MTSVQFQRMRRNFALQREHLAALQSLFGPATEPPAPRFRPRGGSAQTAIHEAGHAIALMAAGHCPTRVTIEHEGTYSGCTETPRGVSRRHLAIALLAAPMAEAMARGESPFSVRPQYEWGTSRTIGGDRTDWDMYQERVRTPGQKLDTLWAAGTLVERHWQAIHRLAQQLLKRGTILENELKQLFRSLRNGEL